MALLREDTTQHTAKTDQGMQLENHSVLRKKKTFHDSLLSVCFVNLYRWYKYDDQDVSEISPNDVKSANAYILFYAAVK